MYMNRKEKWLTRNIKQESIFDYIGRGKTAEHEEANQLMPRKMTRASFIKYKYNDYKNKMNK